MLCQDRSGACCQQQQDKFTNLHGDHQTLLPLHYCSRPRVRWRAWADWGSYIFWQELVMDYIIVARITKRLMWLSRCLRHRIATRLRFHVHDASHDPTLESIHVDFTPYIKCTLLLSCDGGYVYTFAKYLSVLVNSCCWRALYWWSWQKKCHVFYSRWSSGHSFYTAYYTSTAYSITASLHYNRMWFLLH